MTSKTETDMGRKNELNWVTTLVLFHFSGRCHLYVTFITKGLKCEYVEGALYLRVFHEPVYKDNMRAAM